jgi:hypothetical protein
MTKLLREMGHIFSQKAAQFYAYSWPFFSTFLSKNLRSRSMTTLFTQPAPIRKKCSFYQRRHWDSSFILSLSVSGKKANGVPRSNSLGCGSLTPPTVRKSRLHALGRLFKPWKWKRKRKSDKFEAASKSKCFLRSTMHGGSVFLWDASKKVSVFF